MEKLLIKRLVFLIVFAEIALGITYCLILNNTSDVIEISENTIITEEEASKIKTVKLDETYDLNDLKISEYEVTLENANYETTNYDSNGIPTKREVSDLIYSYFQIDGLKDESVEISINYSLKNDLETTINDILEGEDFSSDLYVYADTYSAHANFGNVISLEYVISYVSTSNEYKNMYICENFDLETGNRLKLCDVILNTANMRQILSEKLYNSVLTTNSDLVIVDENTLEYSVENYDEIEETIFEIVNKFNNGKDINFTFNEYQITFPEFGCNILYKNCLDYVIIYDKFNNNDLFDGTYSNLKELPVLTKIDKLSEYQIFEEGENYFIYIILDSEVDDNILAGEKSPVAKLVDEKVEEFKTIASQNPDTFYILNNSYGMYATSIWNNETYTYDFNYSLYHVFEYSYELQTTKSRYENELKDEIIEILRDYPEEEMGELYLTYGIFADYMFDEDFYYIINDYLYDVSTSEIYLDTTSEYYDLEDDEEELTIWDTID